MVLDSLINPISRARSKKRFEKYLINYVKKEFFYNKQSTHLFIFMPPWSGTLAHISKLKKTIMKKGYSYLAYEFSPNILSQKPYLTTKVFIRIEKGVKKDINNLIKKYKFKQCTIIGISLGSVNALMIAKNNPDIQRIILLTTGDSLAEGLWKGIATQYLRKSMEKKGITLKKLKQYWKELEPKNNLNGLKGKEITIYLSKADKIVPYSHGRKLITIMKKKGLNPKVIENKYLGHYCTITKFYISKKSIP